MSLLCTVSHRVTGPLSEARYDPAGERPGSVKQTVIALSQISMEGGSITEDGYRIQISHRSARALSRHLDAGMTE